jgi:RND family efflux transporter MFP subunit
MRILLMALLLTLVACQKDDAGHGHAHDDHDSWSVTVWGDRYEVFAECDPLVAGATARAHTHVTVLPDYHALASGTVTATLLSRDGRKSVFSQDAAAREGVFPLEITAPAPGRYLLVFRVEGDAGVEDIAAGEVTVTLAHERDHADGHSHGDAETDEGEHVHDPARDHGHGHADGDNRAHSAETVAFLKEQQWHTEFRTARAGVGDVAMSVRAPATIRAAAGADVQLTAPLDGVVTADTRVFTGREVRRGDELVRLSPRANSSVTLPELEAETGVARARLARLEELLKMGAVSQAEVDQARARVAALEPRLDAARGTGSGSLVVRAPFDGRIAVVSVTPGAAVNAGDPLVRVVRTPPVWVEAAVSPRDVARLNVAPTRLVLEMPGAPPVIVDGTNLRPVSVAPQVDPATGTVAVILEVVKSIGFPLGSLVTAEILLPGGASSGVVVPASAIVDDAGTPVIYVQLEGESFERRAVRIVARQAGFVQVDGVNAGERVVTTGGNDIRRAALLSTGQVEGHVH